MNVFQRKPVPAGGNNFDPLQSSLKQSAARVPERTLTTTDGAAPRSLLHFVEDLAQAALNARNEFLVRCCAELARANCWLRPVCRQK